MIYLTKEEFEFFKRLKEGFLKRAAKFFRKSTGSKKERSEKPVERQSGENNKEFEYRNSGAWKRRETLRWQWIRAYEYDKEMRSEQRYEWQGKVAEKIIKGAGYNKIINY